uniref:Uncharacterized protein n=1 Tax=Arion vulgaris TaxID=1028688 RepID=A0A0B7AKS1_9EUPU
MWICKVTQISLEQKRATEEMLAMDMTDIEKTDRKHCKTSILLEPSGKGLELPEEESWRLI